MAAVLHFPTDMRRDRRRDDAERRASGTDEARGLVVIFPGVRIQRGGLDLSRRLNGRRPAEDNAMGGPADRG